MNKIAKKYEICASSILVYKNKIILLYDCNKKHYILPQDHKHKNETKLITAKIIHVIPGKATGQEVTPTPKISPTPTPKSTLTPTPTE